MPTLADRLEEIERRVLGPDKAQHERAAKLAADRAEGQRRYDAETAGRADLAKQWIAELDKLDSAVRAAAQALAALHRISGEDRGACDRQVLAVRAGGLGILDIPAPLWPPCEAGELDPLRYQIADARTVAASLHIDKR